MASLQQVLLVLVLQRNEEVEQESAVPLWEVRSMKSELPPDAITSALLRSSGDTLPALHPVPTNLPM